MLKPQELRIGNWFAYDDTEERVTLEVFKTWADNKGAIDFCRPTPLTEEWLLRFGFKKSIFGNSRYEFCENLDIQLYEGSYDIFTHDQWDNHENMAQPIQFVHQLQNLYFALTGEELTIKETITT